MLSVSVPVGKILPQVLGKSADIRLMSNVAEIASMAGYISSQKLAETNTQAQISVLKQSIDAESQIQQQIISMMQSIQPHLGTNVNMVA